MDSLSKLRAKVDAFKAIFEYESISPLRLGSLLSDILEFAADVESRLSSIVNSFINTVQSAINTHNSEVSSILSDQSEKITAIAPRTISLSRLDSMGTDGSVDQMAAVVQNASHSRWLVRDDAGHTVGTLDVSGDSSGHVLSQILTSHLSFENGNLIAGSNTDGTVRTMYRSFNLGAPESFEVAAGKWTKWKELEPEGVRAALNLLSPVFFDSEDEYERMKESGLLDPKQWYAVYEED